MLAATISGASTGSICRSCMRVINKNPAIFANSTLWGQVDSFTSVFSLLAVYLASVNPVFSAISLALGTIVKPQAALAGIPILFIAYQNKWKIERLVTYGIAGLVVFILGFLPFTTLSNLFSFVGERLGVTLSQYQYTSVNAFSFWGLGGFWQPDTGQSVIGWVITIGVSLATAWKLRKQKNAEYLVAALIMATYNYARFGDFLEQGYGMQITAGAFDDNLKSKLFALHHIPGNLYYMLLATPQPVFVEGSHVLASPFIKADAWGISIFLTAPYLILLFGLKYKDIFSKLLIVTAVIISIPIITYYGIGWYQFGFRYALDFLPFLFVALMYEYRKNKDKLPTGLLIVFLISAIFNLYLFKDLFLV